VEVQRRRSDYLFRSNRTFLAEVSGIELEAGDAPDGLISPREGMLLYVLAKRAASFGNIVEIGSYLGRSTWFLARGLQDAGSPYRVVSIDPHLGGSEPPYRENLRRTGIADRVDVRVGFSYDVAPEFDEPVGLLWIDGDHSYAGVRRDFDDWFPKLEVGGWYAMHDTVNAWLGPTKLARQLVSGDQALVDVGLVWLTLFGRKAIRGSSRLRARRTRFAFELLTLAQARHNGFGPQRLVEGDPRGRWFNR
jgi:predicted O-methyltransferase YrrM